MNSLRWILQQVFGGRRIRPELLAEDAEWVNPNDAIEPGTRRGADSFNAAISTVFTTWDDVRFDTERVIDSGDDVVALGQLWGRVDGAGMEISSPHERGGAPATGGVCSDPAGRRAFRRTCSAHLR